MDERLRTRLQKIQDQIDVLAKIEGQFLYLKAHKDVLYADLFRLSNEKNVASRDAQVYSSQEWKDFSYGLAKTEAEYSKQRRMYELRLKAYDAEHLSFKIEAPVVKRQI